MYRHNNGTVLPPAIIPPIMDRLEGDDMARKSSLSLMLGWFVVAIAGLAVAGFGFGIAQAGGNHSESPVLSLEGLEALEALEKGSSSSPSARVLPSGIDLRYDAD